MQIYRDAVAITSRLKVLGHSARQTDSHVGGQVSFEMSFSATHLSTMSRRLLADTSSRDGDDGDGDGDGDEEEEVVVVAGGSAAEVEVKVVLALVAHALALVLLVSAGAGRVERPDRGCQQGLMMTLPDEVVAAAAPTFSRGAPTRYDRALNWASVDPLALLPTA